MNTEKQIRVMQTLRNNRRQAGFTVLEIMVTIAVISVIAGVVIPAVYNEFEKAKLASCFSELNGMRAVAFDLGNGRYIPTPDEFWGEGYPNAEAGEYYYIVDAEDHNKGHGNDLDGCDEDNPGNSIDGRDCLDLKFVVFCNHDHGKLGKYCYATDQIAPTLVGWDDPDPLEYLKQKDMNQGDDPPPEGKEPKSKKPKK
jgi:prepilin-type N-terminal cleavage/methylation domain-containing protein